ncbi:DUF6457 domain-containing protein [Citricoccus nitrophenolicus]|uniref:DUF6457 domain-containing protein n=1 Tax=Citricoccus nitrophenolicus TaxID=863575 RepID=UPI0039B44581
MTDPHDQEIPGLRDWLEDVAEDLHLPTSVVVPGPLLDVARDVAHGIIRPGAPTTTYLIGVAVGLQLAGQDLPAEDVTGLVDRLAHRVQDLASDYEPASATPNQPTPDGA